MSQELYDRYLVALRLINEGKTAEAKAILVELCVPDNSNPFAELNLGSLLARENDFTAAAKHYVRAKAIMQVSDKEQFKDDIEYINMQLCYLTGDLAKKGKKLLDEGDLDGAELCFRVAQEIGGIYADYNLATLQTKRTQYGQAREHLKKCLDIGLDMFSSADIETKKEGEILLAETHNFLGTLDIQGFGCPNETPNVIKAMQNFKSSLAFVPDCEPVKRNIKILESMLKPQSITFFQRETQDLKLNNGRLSFCNFIFEYASTPNINSYIKENPGLTPALAIDDLLSNYLAGTSKKISFVQEENLSDIFEAQMGGLR